MEGSEKQGSKSIKGWQVKEYDLVFHPEAEKEYLAAFIWYENQKSGLGLRFEKMVEERLLQIVSHPEHYSIVKKPFREVAVKFFPFVIVYKLNKRAKAVYITSLFHTSRSPRKKYRRVMDT